MKETYMHELDFCLDLWEEKWGCEFWWETKCDQCATPYLLLKLLTWEVLHEKEITRLSKEDWKKKVVEIKKKE